VTEITALKIRYVYNLVIRVVKDIFENEGVPKLQVWFEYSLKERKMKALRIMSIVAICLFFAETAMAANYYIRGGATGTNSGSDWNNAYTSLPATLIRGSVYYIAGGSYPAYTFDDAESGTTLITVKKATASDHGTDTGWDSSYGTTQAVFNSIIRFNTGYYVFDGQTRNESDWFNGDAYGIRISHNNNDQNIVIVASNISIKYVYINAIYGDAASSTCDFASTTCRRYAIDTDTYGEGTNTGLLFHRMYVYGSNNIWFIRETNGTIIEYSASDGAHGNGPNHAGIVNLYFNANNSITRYCKFRNAFTLGSGGGTALWCITRCGSTGLCGSSNGGHQIYGNEVAHYCTTDGIIGYIGSDSINNKVYNNTFIDGTGKSANCWGAGISLPSSGNVAHNNLWVGWQSGRLSMDTSHDYNAFSGSSNFSEAHGQANIPTSIFSNYSGNNFRLASASSAGTSLSSTYNYDLLGSLRGSDGTWDRGAYEFGGNNTPLIRPNPPILH